MGDEAHDVARRCHVHPGVLAGATAGAAVLLTFPQALRDVATGVPDLAGVDFVQGTVIEAVLTFFLMLVVFGRLSTAAGRASAASRSAS